MDQRWSSRSVFGLALVLVVASFGVGCGAGNQWKIHGGPAECQRMCAAWGLEFTGMVGIGSQAKFGPGATACVCQVVGRPAASAGGGAAAAAAAMSAVITAEEEEEEEKKKKEEEEEKKKEKKKKQKNADGQKT